MKKSLISILILSASISAFAGEVSGIIADSTDVKYNAYSDLVFTQKETLTLSYRQAFSNTAYIATEGSVTHEFDWAINSSTANSITADLGLLKFSSIFDLTPNLNLKLSAGRFAISDISSVVFAQPADGIFLKLSTPVIETSLSANYTGLLNANNTTILKSDGTEYSSDKTGVYVLNAKYANASLVVSFPYIVFNQTISAEVFASIPVDKSDENRFYGTLKFNGALAPNIFYALNTTVQTTDFNQIANFSALTLNFSIPNIPTSIGFNALYASGNNGPFKSFTPVSKRTAVLSTDEQGYTNLTKISVNTSTAFTKTVYLTDEVAAVFENPENFSFKGVQASATGIWQTFTDLQFSLSAKLFFSPTTEYSRQNITFNAKLAF